MGSPTEEVKAKQEDNQGSPNDEKDTEMKEAGNAAEGLAESKHVVKELLEKQIEEMVKEIGLEEEKIKDEDKEME